ncbi:hypothetical protein AAF454_07945 [Kurthia gibsonii]|uniref:Uncharacterized protein n=1 Tax=Kurthia gibsonii TaxID=33946 RepID=A0ABU9LKW5_9BACL
MLNEDIQSIKNNLYCAESGCDCKIEYVPPGIKNAHFKKWRGDNHQHSENCIYYNDNTTGRRPIHVDGEGNVTLNPSRIRQIPREMFERYNETPEDRQARLDASRTTRPSNPRPRTDTSLNTRVVLDARVTTDPNAEVVEEVRRNSRLKRRYSINDISQNDLHTTLIVMGPLTNIELHFENSTERSAILTITDQNGTNEFEIHLDPVFFENSVFGTDRVITTLNTSLQSGSEYILGAIGEIVMRNDKLSMAVFNVNELSLDGRGLFSSLR